MGASNRRCRCKKIPLGTLRCTMIVADLVSWTRYYFLGMRPIVSDLCPGTQSQELHVLINN